MAHPNQPQPVPDPDPPGGGIEVEIATPRASSRSIPPASPGSSARVLRREGIERASISIALVDDATIHRINRTPPRPRLADRRDQLPALRRQTTRSWPASWSSRPRWPRNTAARDRGRPDGRAAPSTWSMVCSICAVMMTRPTKASAVMRRHEKRGPDREGLASTFSLVERRRGPSTAGWERARRGRTERDGDADRGLAGADRAPGLDRADQGAPVLFAEPAGGSTAPIAGVPSGPTR